VNSGPYLDINDQFQQALDLMSTPKKALFITGKAGTGKSTLLSMFCEKAKKKPVVLAPTGVAALNVQGQTIHSFFNFSIDMTVDAVLRKKIKPRVPELFKKLTTIIIDEISMVRADVMDCVDAFLKLYGPHPGEAFGGVKMVFIGDLYQLPPVVTSQERHVFTDHYKTPYFFSAHVMQGLALDMIELEKVYRQKDQDFVDLLNKIRNNSVEETDFTKLNERFGKTPPDDGQFTIHLTTTNAKADEVNQEKLAALKGKMHSSVAEINGTFSKEYYPTATLLQYKIGAQVMMLNNDQRRRWVNGTIGVIKALRTDDEGKEYLKIELSDEGVGDEGESVNVYPHQWEVFKFGVENGQITSEPVGTFRQYPFRLAWAVTVHKSQGKTFDRVSIDLGKSTFAAGQSYVALSRCTSFEGMYLTSKLSKSHIRTDFRIYQFLTGYQYQQSEEALSLEDKKALIAKAIKHKTKLAITYLKANDTKTKRVVAPSRVGKETYQGQEYQGMKAYCVLRDEERMFRVDRILEMKEV
jgi:ATP-dependent DNA helicase PIF1